MQNAYFSFLTHTEQLLFVTFCETSAVFSFQTDAQTNGQHMDGYADMEVKIAF